VDTSGVMVEYEVAPLSSADLYLAGGDAPASHSCREPATRTGSRVAIATTRGRLPLTPSAAAGKRTTHNLGDELPQSSIRARRRIG
jgi:hypothetical protein